MLHISSDSYSKSENHTTGAGSHISSSMLQTSSVDQSALVLYTVSAAIHWYVAILLICSESQCESA